MTTARAPALMFVCSFMSLCLFLKAGRKPARLADIDDAVSGSRLNVGAEVHDDPPGKVLLT